MKRILIAAAAIAIWGMPAMSQATPARPGGYFSGFLGVSIPRDADVSSTDFVNTFNDRVEFDPGIAVGGTAGYDYGFLRLEGELSYRHSEIKAVTDTSDGYRFPGVDGDLGALAVMANAFFDMHNQSPITPYVGGGVGFAVLNLSDTTSTDGPLYDKGDDTVFAYQAGAGVEIALNPIMSLDLGYRYFGTSKATFDEGAVTVTKFKFESHNALMGLRVKF
ncbi:outer membrane beta-barrel protein [Geobacter hydrogenophilus]|uniref:Outer membrane channel protein n=1 Tax=Geobacter hydrogenophilus TaxID=40983 RepID=A0A9W6G464_9BACT|nr:outer membrane beta-barrel protein [Geobacter hydrogenophilus]MBT0892689.1 outer membrane beta-barrel protein [Geobacter hydrogenophilus]GLI40087.1 outer membrane channel protein [Geobacter hydrogenophilus]